MRAHRVAVGHEDVRAENEINEEAVEDRQHHAGEEIDRELARPPLALQRGADEIVKVKRDDREDAGAGRDDDEGHDPPDLPAQNEMGREIEIVQNARSAAGKRGEQVEKPDDGAAHHDIKHQIPDAEARVLIAEDVDFFHQRFHADTPSILILKPIIPPRRRKVTNNL